MFRVVPYPLLNCPPQFSWKFFPGFSYGYLPAECPPGAFESRPCVEALAGFAPCQPGQPRFLQGVTQSRFCREATLLMSPFFAFVCSTPRTTSILIFCPVCFPVIRPIPAVSLPFSRCRTNFLPFQTSVPSLSDFPGVFYSPRAV